MGLLVVLVVVMRIMLARMRKTHLQGLLDSRFSWFQTALLEDGQAGITDEIHKVEGEGSERFQYELKEDENAYMFKLGFTVKEIEGLINA